MTRLWFHAYDHQRRVGGQKHTYAQVDALVAHGFDACVVHASDGFRLDWFANDTRVIGATEHAKLYDRERDILVLPEDLGDRIATLPGRKVIFNKSVHHGFRALGAEVERPTPYERPDVIATLAVSEHNARILRFAFPSLHVAVTRPGFDVERFAPAPLAEKRKQIAWATKNPSAVASLRHLLAARTRQGANALADARSIWLAELDEVQMIAALRESLVVVFLGVEEGFGMLPREAALCGCVVIAFDGGTLDELAPEELVAPGDLLGAAHRIEQVVAASSRDLARWQAVVDDARIAVARHTLTAAGDEAVAAWRGIVGDVATT